MKRFRNQAFYKEFPFLSKWKEEEHEPLIFEAEISIKRLDNEILRETIDEEFRDGSLVDYENCVRIIGVLDDNSFVEDYNCGYYYESNYAHQEPRECPGETIAEWIDRMGVAERLCYIIIHRYGHDYVSDSREERWNYLTIYKPPKGTTIQEIIDKFKEKEAKKVQREISF